MGKTIFSDSIFLVIVLGGTLNNIPICSALCLPQLALRHIPKFLGVGFGIDFGVDFGVNVGVI